MGGSVLRAFLAGEETGSQAFDAKHVIPGWSEGPDPESRVSGFSLREPRNDNASWFGKAAFLSGTPHPEEARSAVSKDGRKSVAAGTPRTVMVRDGESAPPQHEVVLHS